MSTSLLILKRPWLRPSNDHSRLVFVTFSVRLCRLAENGPLQTDETCATRGDDEYRIYMSTRSRQSRTLPGPLRLRQVSSVYIKREAAVRQQRSARVRLLLPCTWRCLHSFSFF